MKTQAKSDIKRKWRPSANTGTGILVRLNPTEIKLLDRYKRSRELSSRPAALRYLLETYA